MQIDFTASVINNKGKRNKVIRRNNMQLTLDGSSCFTQNVRLGMTMPVG